MMPGPGSRIGRDSVDLIVTQRCAARRTRHDSRRDDSAERQRPALSGGVQRGGAMRSMSALIRLRRKAEAPARTAQPRVRLPGPLQGPGCDRLVRIFPIL